MSKDLVTTIDRQNDGKAMSALSDKHRQFVIELMELGPTKKAAAEAAERAGFSSLHGYKLMRDQRILEAIREESGKQLAGGVVIGVKTLIEIAQDENHKDRYKAAKELAGINGFSAEQKITVEHVTRDTSTMIVEIRNMARELGMDPVAVLKSIGIEDAEFSEVENEEAAPLTRLN